MARYVNLKLSGPSEKFLIDMEKAGLTETDVFAKALSLLKDVWKTKRVGRIKRGHENSEICEFIYGINVVETEEKTDQELIEESLEKFTSVPVREVELHEHDESSTLDIMSALKKSLERRSKSQSEEEERREKRANP